MSGFSIFVNDNGHWDVTWGAGQGNRLIIKFIICPSNRNRHTHTAYNYFNISSQAKLICILFPSKLPFAFKCHCEGIMCLQLFANWSPNSLKQISFPTPRQKRYWPGILYLYHWPIVLRGLLLFNYCFAKDEKFISLKFKVKMKIIFFLWSDYV